MSIFDNETSKIYPDLNPTAPQEPQRHRLNKLSEIEAFCLNEIVVRGQNAKKKKRLSKMTIVDTDLITSAVTTGGLSIATSATVFGLPVGIALGGITIVFPLATITTRKSFKTLTVKQKKTFPLSCLPKASETA